MQLFLLLLSLITLPSYGTFLFSDPYDSEQECEKKYTVEGAYKALFYKLSGTNAPFPAQVIPATLPASVNIFEYNARYQYGFTVSSRLKFNERSTSLFAEWVYYKNFVCGPQQHGPYLEVNPTSATSPFVDAHFESSFHLNMLNVTYAQEFKVRDHFLYEIFTGLTYVELFQNVSFVYSATTTDMCLPTIDTSTMFNAAGPLFGCNLTYNIIGGINFKGLFGAIIVAGPFNSTIPYNPEIPADFSAQLNPQVFKQRVYHVACGFIDRIGFQYLHTGKYVFKLEAGYEGRIFINPSQPIVTKSIAILAAPDGENTTYAHLYPPVFNMFAALAGPYLVFTLVY